MTTKMTTVTCNFDGSITPSSFLFAACAMKSIEGIPDQYRHYSKDFEYRNIRDGIASYIKNEKFEIGENTLTIPATLEGYRLVVKGKPTPLAMGSSNIPKRQVAPNNYRQTQSKKLDWLQKVIDRYGEQQARLFELAVKEYCREKGINPNHLMATMAVETGGTFDTKQLNKETFKGDGRIDGKTYKNIDGEKVFAIPKGHYQGKPYQWIIFDITDEYLDKLTVGGKPRKIKNSQGEFYTDGFPYAIGLIQFTPIAVKDMGLMLTDIYHATLLEQFDFVKEYFDRNLKRKKIISSTMDHYTLYMLIFTPEAARYSPDVVIYNKDRHKDKYYDNRSVDTNGGNNDGNITKRELGYRVDYALRAGKKYARTLLDN
jgi:hypothetical protein